MKNWKRVLAAGLCGVTALGTMPTSAFAVTGTDVADDNSYSTTVEVCADDDSGFYYNYDLEVSLTVSGGKISDLSCKQITKSTDADAVDEAEDNEGYIDEALNGYTKRSGTVIKGLKEQLVGKDATAATADAFSKLDGVSGATYSSNAIKSAVAGMIANASAHEHNYAEKITKEATCKEDGEKVLTCTCGDTKTEVIPATGNHTWGEPVVTKEATEDEEGEETYTCSVCGETKTETISKIVKEAMSSVSIGGISYYYADTTGDADNTIYTATVTSRMGSTVYEFSKADMTQVDDTAYYYATVTGVTPLSGTLYALADGTATNYKTVYGDLGVNTDDAAYDAVTSATNFTSGHAKDISSVVTYSTDTEGNKSITGLNLGRTYAEVDADAYVAANILKAAGETLTADQEALAAKTLKENPTAAPSTVKVAPVAATATWSDTCSYGDGEFVINPDTTVEGYVWSEYWDNVYAVTISDGTTTAGAVHWIDVYGEKSTSGFHYNKLEIAMNNGTSVGKNAATVNRFAAFYDEDGNVKAGTYTITVYADGYEPMTASVDVHKEAMSSVAIGGVTYYYAETTDDAANTIYTATVSGRGGSTVYEFTQDDMTQVGDTAYYYATLSTATPLSGTLYAVEGTTASNYKTVYSELGVNTDDAAYDAVSSATNFTSYHAKDIASVVTYGTDAEGNKAITGLSLDRTYSEVDADAYVTAKILQAAGETLTEEQEALAAKTLKKNPTEAPSATKVAPVAATATWSDTCSYGDGEFVINPDTTVEGYVWSEYWDNVYAVTISDGTTTAGAVHWIDVYGEESTSGFHYNKLEIAINNGESVGKNQATVNRFAAFYDEDGNVKAGTYTITVYADGYEPMTATVDVHKEAMSSVSIGGITYFYADTTGDAANTIYSATVTSRMGSTVYEFTKDQMTQVSDTGYYYANATGVTPLSGTLYAVEGGTASNYKTVYGGLGVNTDDAAYDAVSSATNFTSFHAKDIASVVTYSTDADGNKSITGLNLDRTYTALDADAYVAANILKAAGETLTEEQEALTAKTLKKNPTAAPSATKVAPVAATATWSDTCSYGDGEFVINPDTTVEGYVWSEYWDNVYAVTISDGTTTAGAVHWIDVYGEESTSGFHYNKLEIAMNNGTSVGKNAATVNRFAAFYDAEGNFNAGTYTITVYADGYEPMTASVDVHKEAMSSVAIGGVTYYYADTTDDAANTIYTATVNGRGGSTDFPFTKADMTQVGDTEYYYATLSTATPLSGTLYAFEDGTASNYKTVYSELGVNTDDAAYDAVSSATNFTSYHAKDISSIVTYSTDADGNKSITGLNLNRTCTEVDADAYVTAKILQAAGAEITAEQEALAAKTLKKNPTVAPSETKVAPVAATATWSDTCSYGIGEFVINPDTTVEGYVWSEYWDNVYAVTISNGTTTAGAVHWIDVYGEESTSGFHYNKLEIAINNGESVGKNAATVNRFAAFMDAQGNLKGGTYTITVYADGYEPMTASVEVESKLEGLNQADDGNWYYYTSGEVDTTVTGLVEKDDEQWYVVKGKADFTVTGLVKSNGKWYYVKNGVYVPTYTGMAKNQYNWWYVKNGTIDFTYTGMAKNQYGWWYMTKGKLNSTYTGLGTNTYGTWYFKNGKLMTSFSGKVKIGSKTYTIKNGKVV